MRDHPETEKLYDVMSHMSDVDLAKRILNANGTPVLSLIKKEPNDDNLRVKQRVTYPFSISGSLEACIQDDVKKAFYKAFNIFGKKIENIITESIGNKDKIATELEIKEAAPNWTFIEMKKSSVSDSDRTDWYINTCFSFKFSEQDEERDPDPEKIILERIVMFPQGSWQQEPSPKIYI